MTANPIESDSVLWRTLRTRGKKHKPILGWDAKANRWQQRLRLARQGVSFLRQQAMAADALDASISALPDRELDEQILQMRTVFARRQYTDAQLYLAVACVREAAFRTMGYKPYIVQMMGALGLLHGQIIEMQTGEGKTVTAALAGVLLGWLGLPVHLITVNDYLAQRDAQLNKPLFDRCGIEVGYITAETEPASRASMYVRPLVYTTQKELVADWLRDAIQLGSIQEAVSARWLIKPSVDRPCPVLVPGLHVAIVDELDAVLIDEAVTPLIIAAARSEDPQGPLYLQACQLAQKLLENTDFKVNALTRQVALTHAGEDRIEALLAQQAQENPHVKPHAVWSAVRRREELIAQALAALHCYHEGKQYQIIEDQVMIVDEYTGRFMKDRQWQHGLHQAVEAKHALDITADQDTLASMSFQRFFRQYPHLCGMTGTAVDAQAELETTYSLPVRIIPTHRPCQRVAWPDQIFASHQAKWQAVVGQVKQLHQQSRPVLIGTRSVQASQKLSQLLDENHLTHQVLNAVNHEQEAQIVTQAGQRGAITVATNMAGRGTDIKLGKKVASHGGLHVILTERHTARRIDRQLFGRAGRQGDPGSSQCFLSLEDDLLLQQIPRIVSFVKTFYSNRITPLPGRLIWLFDHAQRRAQRQAFKSRESVVRHEDQLEDTLPGS